MIHNAIKSGQLIQRAAAAASGLGAEEEGLQRLGETLTPVMDLWMQPEWAFLRGERLCGMMRTVALVAAEFGMQGIGNPVGSNMIVVVERAGALSNTLQITSGITLLATALVTLGSSSGVLRDRRNNSVNFVSQAVNVFGTDASVSALAEQQLEFRQAAASSTVDFLNLPVILRPGDAYVLVSQTANTAFTCWFGWRERLMLPAERARG